MKNELLAIFKAITPDNIKDLQIINDSMEIFIELLCENSYISIDIKKALSENTTSSIEEELPIIYLNDYYSMIENLRTNKTIVNKFKKWNAALNQSLYPVGMPIISDLLKINYFIIGEDGESLKDVESDDSDLDTNINSLSEKLKKLSDNILKNTPENYYINRKFKESKGLKKSIQFIYDIVNEYMVNQYERKELVFTETGKPFEIELISGSLDKNIYEESVAYLAHPLGFTYEYTYVSELIFDDIFGLSKFYNIKLLEVRCLSGNIEQYNKDVFYIDEKQDYLKIIFLDGTYLIQENDIVRYFNNDETLIKIYPEENHCSIFLDYNIIYKPTITDNISLKETLYNQDIVQSSDETNYILESDIAIPNFIIGVSEIDIDTEKLSNDTDQFEYSKIKEEFDIQII